MRLVSGIAAVVALAACSSKSTSNGPPIALAELKIFDGVELAAHLHPDGRLDAIAGGKLQHVATIAVDGSITTVKDAKTAHVKPDGTLVDPDGKTVPGFQLDGAALVIDGKRITISDKGFVLFDGVPDALAARVEGASDAKLQRTALIVFALMGEDPRAPAGSAAARP